MRVDEVICNSALLNQEYPQVESFVVDTCTSVYDRDTVEFVDGPSKMLKHREELLPSKSRIARQRFEHLSLQQQTSMSARQGVDILMALVNAELTCHFSTLCQSSN